MEKQQANAYNACVDYIAVYPDPSTHPFVIALFIILYLFVFVLGLFGNVGLIVATFRYRSLQTVQNIFIVNLAAADVILCVLSIPLTPVTAIFKEWVFGGMQAIGTFIGTFSLCAIAVDRYFRLVLAPDICGHFCTEKWSSTKAKHIYTVFVLIVQFFVPFTIMTICYRKIFAFLRKRAANRLTSIGQQANLLYVLTATAGGNTQTHKEQLGHLIDQKKRVIAQKRRVTLILVSMVIIFGVTALPHNIVSLLLEHDLILKIGDADLQYIAALGTHFLAMLTCVANPLLYAFLNPEFRQLVLGGLRFGQQPVYSTVMLERTTKPDDDAQGDTQETHITEMDFYL